MITTRAGKKMKKCSKGGWDREKRQATGCDFVEWFNGSKEDLNEDCPKCGVKLVMVTTASGKQMKKCSTSGWDREAKKATGCDFVEWQNSRSTKNTDSVSKMNGDENFPDYE
jgi:hypothetical protein